MRNCNAQDNRVLCITLLRSLMTKLKVNNNILFETNINSIIKTLDFDVTEELRIEAHHQTEPGFKIKRNGCFIDIYYNKDHYFYNAFAYVLMYLEEKQYIYEQTATVNHMGLMLDAARNAVPKIETIKSYIQLIALLGFNYMELYVEDVFEVINEPKIGYMRGKYTINDLKDLDQYALSYGVELIPCIQTLAHLERIFMHDTYSEINDIEDVLLVGQPKTYELIENMLKTCKEAFSAKRINIGMDEAFRLGLGAYLSKNGYHTKTTIMLEHLEAVSKLLDKYEYHGMMWADMFFQMSGGNYHLDEVVISDEVIKRVPKNITLIFWEYYDTAYDKYDRKFKQIRRMTTDYSFAGGAWKWVGFTPLNAFSIKAMDVSIQACHNHQVDDYLVTLWGDDGAEASIYSVLPSLIHASQSFYTHKDQNEIENRLALLLTKYRFDELMKLDSLNQLETTSEVHNPSKYLLFDDILMGRLDYPVHESFSSFYQMKSKELSILSNKKSGYHYVFDTQFTLARVLSTKTKLSVNLYRYYKEKDLIGLANLVDEFDVLQEELKCFYKAFTYQWHKENKALGFEVQNYRIGGLLSRLEYGKWLLIKYLNHEITSIDALEEKIVDETSDKVVAYNGFLRTVTYGKM